MLSSSQIMTRLILTFETVFQVLAADKLLKERFQCRTVPTPAGLSTSICGISIELLQAGQEKEALSCLESDKLSPSGVYHVH